MNQRRTEREELAMAMGWTCHDCRDEEHRWSYWDAPLSGAVPFPRRRPEPPDPFTQPNDHIALEEWFYGLMPANPMLDTVEKESDGKTYIQVEYWLDEPKLTDTKSGDTLMEARTLAILAAVREINNFTSQ